MEKKGNQFHACRAIVVSCMDFRLRNHLNNWTKKTLKNEGFDLVAVAGGVKNLAFILEQVGLSHKLHHTKEVYFINHEDCGAYGKEGSFRKHKEDLQSAKKALQKKIPHLKIYLFYLKLSGDFVKI